MMNKFQNKYRNESTRLQSWDYGANAAYFLTICTASREHYFGEILDSKQMELSEIGQYAHKCWSDIPSHFPFVFLDAFIVMPDHIHGIIIINKQNINGDTVGTQNEIEFGWQSRYHDHIIRNEPELERIRKYIITNPMNWGNDR